MTLSRPSKHHFGASQRNLCKSILVLLVPICASFRSVSANCAQTVPVSSGEQAVTFYVSQLGHRDAILPQIPILYFVGNRQYEFGRR